MTTALLTPLSITPCLWFAGHAEDAARHYVALFPSSGIDAIVRAPSEGHDHHGIPEGAAMTVAFHLGATHFLGLNGPPIFHFSEAVSFIVGCDTQEELDRMWDGLLAGGGSPGQCGWLKDRFGVSWQLVPKRIAEIMTSGDPAVVGRVMAAFMPMSKIDIATIERAARGE